MILKKDILLIENLNLILLQICTAELFSLEVKLLEKVRR
jgi:hypothetical protein